MPELFCTVEGRHFFAGQDFRVSYHADIARARCATKGYALSAGCGGGSGRRTAMSLDMTFRPR